jgi:hypothetical protein
MGKYGGGVSLTHDLLLRWIGITILLSIYRVTIKKLFSKKFVDFGVREHMSEKVYRRIWGSLCLPNPRSEQERAEGKWVVLGI